MTLFWFLSGVAVKSLKSLFVVSLRSFPLLFQVLLSSFSGPCRSFSGRCQVWLEEIQQLSEVDLEKTRKYWFNSIRLLGVDLKHTWYALNGRVAWTQFAPQEPVINLTWRGILDMGGHFKCGGSVTRGKGMRASPRERTQCKLSGMVKEHKLWSFSVVDHQCRHGWVSFQREECEERCSWACFLWLCAFASPNARSLKGQLRSLLIPIRV